MQESTFAISVECERSNLFAKLPMYYWARENIPKHAKCSIPWILHSKSSGT